MSTTNNNCIISVLVLLSFLPIMTRRMMICHMISKDKFDCKVIWKMYFQIELHVEVGGAIAEMSVGSIAFKKVKGRRQNPIIVCFKEISWPHLSIQSSGREDFCIFIYHNYYLVVRTSSLTLCMATSSPRLANLLAE